MLGPMRKLALLSLIAVGCGGAPSATSTTTSPGLTTTLPPMEAGVTSPAALRQLATTLHDLGGEHLTRLMTPLLTDAVPLPIADDRPVRLVLDDDGAWILAAGAPRDGAAVEAAVRAAWPTAAASVSTGGKLWTTPDAVVAVHGDAVYLVRGDAPSSRARAALRLADDGGLAGPAPVEGGAQLWAAAEGEPLLTLLGVRPATATSLGAQLGRTALNVKIEPDVVSWIVDATPASGSIMAELLTHPPTTSEPTPTAIVGIAGMLPPDMAFRLVTTLIVEAGLLESGEIGRDLQHPLSGYVALSPAGVTMGVPDMDARSAGVGAGHVGLQNLWGTGGGVTTKADETTRYTDSIQWCPIGLFGALPAALPAVDERLLPDDNADVPWSYEFKAERGKIEEAIGAAQSADKAVDVTRLLMQDRRAGLLEPLRASFVPHGPGLRAQQAFRPPSGFDGMRDEVRTTLATYVEVLERQRVAHAALDAARAAAIKVRAADVAAWDRNGGHAP